MCKWSYCSIYASVSLKYFACPRSTSLKRVTWDLQSHKRLLQHISTSFSAFEFNDLDFSQKSGHQGFRLWDVT